MVFHAIQLTLVLFFGTISFLMGESLDDSALTPSNSGRARFCSAYPEYQQGISTLQASRENSYMIRLLPRPISGEGWGEGILDSYGFDYTSIIVGHF